MFRILINGDPGDVVSVTDRGLHYGDGLFETLAVHDGMPRRWDRHWRRLVQGCERLGIEGIVEETLRDEARRVCAGMDQGVLKLLVTRGPGGRGYRPPQKSQATRTVAGHPWPNYPGTYWREGVTVRLCSTRMGRNPVLAGIKHLNRLEQVMARREWNDPGIAEGLMRNDLDHVISGTMTNLFMVKDGRLSTPSIIECGVAGVMRGVILELARELELATQETIVTLHDLHEAEEVFLCNALIGVWPVRRLEQREYTLGPVTSSLSERLQAQDE